MFIADTVTSCPDILSLQIRRPIDRGYIVSFDLQRDIWSRCVGGVGGSLAEERYQVSHLRLYADVT